MLFDHDVIKDNGKIMLLAILEMFFAKYQQSKAPASSSHLL